MLQLHRKLPVAAYQLFVLGCSAATVCLSCPKAMWSRPPSSASKPERLGSTCQSLDAAAMASWAGGSGGWQTLVADHMMFRRNVPLRSCRRRPKRRWTNTPRVSSDEGRVRWCASASPTLNCDGRACSGDESRQGVVALGFASLRGTCTPYRFRRVQVHVPTPADTPHIRRLLAECVIACWIGRGRRSGPSSWLFVECTEDRRRRESEGASTRPGSRRETKP